MGSLAPGGYWAICCRSLSVLLCMMIPSDCAPLHLHYRGLYAVGCCRLSLVSDDPLFGCFHRAPAKFLFLSGHNIDVLPR